MNEMQIFSNTEFGSIRTVSIDGEPWFVGKDIAKVLGYSNTKDALAKHVDSEDKRGSQIATPGGEQTMIVINESGMYALVFGSKLPSAKRFKHWVTSEVLPAIRKTGRYEPQDYAPKATSVGEVVNLIKVTKEAMEGQGCSPTDIARAVKEICGQFNISLPNCFVKPKETIQDMYDMVDFIYSQPRGRGYKTPTYEDYLSWREQQEQQPRRRRRYRGE